MKLGQLSLVPGEVAPSISAPGLEMALPGTTPSVHRRAEGKVSCNWWATGTMQTRLTGSYITLVAAVGMHNELYLTVQGGTERRV